jgi:hypothetical protein
VSPEPDAEASLPPGARGAASDPMRFERQVPGIPLVLLESPYRQLVRPLIRYFEYAAERAPNDVFVVLLPEYVPRHWWESLLYNDNGRRIRDGLLGRPNVVVANVPYRREA